MKLNPIRANGYSVVEIVTTVFLIGIISVGASALFIWGFRLWRISDEESRIINQYQTAYEKIVAEIREMRISSNGSYPIESATATELIYYTNTDSDDDRERVRLTLSGTSIIKGIIQPVGSPATYPAISETVNTIAQNIRNTNIFSYHDENFTGSQAAMNPIIINNIRLVKILITIDINTTQAPGPVDLTTYISIRNLKQNL